MGASQSYITDPKELHAGVDIVDRAIQEQYRVLQDLTRKCNALSAEKKKKEAEAKQIEENIKTCRSTLQVLQTRDSQLRGTVGAQQARYNRLSMNAGYSGGEQQEGGGYNQERGYGGGYS